jgi:hypothetical protein
MKIVITLPYSANASVSFLSWATFNFDIINLKADYYFNNNKINDIMHCNLEHTVYSYILYCNVIELCKFQKYFTIAIHYSTVAIQYSTVAIQYSTVAIQYKGCSKCLYYSISYVLHLARMRINKCPVGSKSSYLSEGCMAFLATFPGAMFLPCPWIALPQRKRGGDHIPLLFSPKTNTVLFIVIYITVNRPCQVSLVISLLIGLLLFPEIIY